MIKKFLFILAFVLFIPAPAEAATITRPSNGLGLVGYWTFDGPDMTSNIRDRAGSNHGLLSGFTSTSSIIGKLGQALRFDGVDDYVQTTSSDLKTADSFTISTWFRISSTTNPGHILWEGVSTGNGWGGEQELHLTMGWFNGVTIETDKLAFWFGQTNTQDAAALSTYYVLPDLYAWHNAIIVIKEVSTSPTLDLYVDGVLVASDTGTSAFLTRTSWDTNLRIGSPGANQRYFNGSVDDTRIYNRALSANEAKALYNAGGARTNVTQVNKLTDGLVGHWTFDGSKMTSNVADSSGYGNSGYLQGQTSTTTAIGKIGQALRFDGVDDYVAVSDHTSLDIAGTMTATMWVKIESMELTGGPTNTLGLIDKKIGDYGDADGFLIWAWSSGGERFWLTGSGNGEAISSVVDVDDKQWHFMAFTVDGTTGRIYRDMVDITADSVMPAIVANNDQLTLGYKQTVDTANVGGIMDDVRIYNRVLSLSELNQLYNMGR